MSPATALAVESNSTLQIVATELSQELNAARSALEAFAERPEDPALLSAFATHLHLAHGALRIAEVYGGSLLAEEMELVARHVATHTRGGKTDMDGLDALMRAIEQLPSYVDRVLSGGRDLPLALLPLLNDLRAVRGGALLSEGTLLTLNLHSDEAAHPVDARSRDVAEVARKLRPRFQLALLGWIRGDDVHRNLATLADVAEQVEMAAATQAVFQVWWVVGAVLEALRNGGLDGTASVKRLLGQADRDLKRLIETGEARHAAQPAQELLNNLLFYVARSTAAGPRLSAVSESFRLADVLPPESEIDVAEHTLSAPSVRLMKTVAAAIREDLTRVKDVLDIFVRRGSTQVDELVPQLEMLRKIGDTLGVLGLGAQRDRVQVELALLKSIVDQRVPPDDAALLRIAAALIEVEDSLDGQLVRLIVKDPADAALPAAGLGDSDFLKVQEAVLRECVVNMARIKEAVTQALGAPNEAQGLDQVPQLVRGITAGLLMLGRQRAVEIMERVGRALSRMVRPDRESFAGDHLDRLADALVAVEYYMETLHSGRSEPLYLLENAAVCLDAIDADGELDQTASQPVLRDGEGTRSGRGGAIRRGDSGSRDATQIIPAPRFGADGEPSRRSPAQEAERPAPPAPPVAIVADPEFVTLFIEEARENIAVLETLFPRWVQDAQDSHALLDLRRAFHTLKGSGRIVGAVAVGEFSWSVENLLNRVISQTLPRSPEIVAVVRAAIEALPSLVSSLERSTEPDAAIAAIAARADGLAGRESLLVLPPGEPVPSLESLQTLLAEARAAAADAAAEGVQDDADNPYDPDNIYGGSGSLTAEEIEAAVDPSTVDPLLRDIFRNEAAGHVSIVRDFLQRSAGLPPPVVVTEALYRACHTLSGIARTAGIRQGSKIAEPMDRVVRKLHDNGHGLSAEALLLLEHTVASLEDVVAHLEEDTGYFPSQPQLIVRWHALEQTLDHEFAQAIERETAAREAEAAVALATIEAEQVQTQVLPDQHLAELVEADIDLTSPELLLPTAPDEPIVPQALIDAVAELQAEADASGAAQRIAIDERELDFDADIAAIFSEEAAELLEQAEVALSAWSRDRADGERLIALKRALHTLKGGARMAGLRAMGDLSHELESFLAMIEFNSTLVDAHAIDVLQLSIDQLHRLREASNAGAPAPEATALIARVHALANGQPEVWLPPEAIVTAPEASVPAYVEPVASEPVVDVPVTRDPDPVEAPEAPEALEALEADSVVAGPTPEAPVYAEPFFIESPAVRAAEPAPEAPAEITCYTIAAEDSSAAPRPLAPIPGLPGREPAAAPERQELARVDADLLDELLNNAGEVSIFRARIEQQMTQAEFNLAELGRTVTRLRDQLRKLEIETEAQVLFRHQSEVHGRPDFDPLELDRYSSIQQLSRAMAESVSDVASIENLLESLNRDAQNLLHQQSRIVAELQNGLMRTRMVPFQRHVQRLSRIVRQAAQETGKKAELVVDGASGELDRQVLERMLPPFEHMLRNSIVHGIEAPAERLAAGKPETGQVRVQLQREGAEVVIVVADDGMGLNLAAIRAKAAKAGLVQPGQSLTDEEALQLILEPGFSTADRLTQQAGRGVGMDVVATEVKKLGGGLYIESTTGSGTRFTIRLPFTLAITQSLLVRVGEETYALPVATVEGVARVPKADVQRHLDDDAASFEYGGQTYRFQSLGSFLGSGAFVIPDSDAALPVILVRAGEHSAALVAEELIGSREIVVKSVGPQIAGIRGVSGATILGDGRIVLILDMGALVRSEWRSRPQAAESQPVRDERVFALVVDDSITVRRVTQRLLKRNGMRVLTAKDGVEALSLLQEHTPDVILLDIEMPRMDGYEVAAHVRSDPRLASVPIIMITSRVGEKHRARAIELGVDDYLGKPYQESQLLDAIEPLVFARRGQVS